MPGASKVKPCYDVRDVAGTSCGHRHTSRLGAAECLFDHRLGCKWAPLSAGPYSMWVQVKGYWFRMLERDQRQPQ